MSPRALTGLPTATVRSALSTTADTTTMEFCADHRRADNIVMVLRDYEGNVIAHHISQRTHFEAAAKYILGVPRPAPKVRTHDCDWGSIEAQEDGSLTCAHGHAFGPGLPTVTNDGTHSILTWELGDAAPAIDALKGLQRIAGIPDEPSEEPTGETPPQSAIEALSGLRSFDG